MKYRSIDDDFKTIEEFEEPEKVEAKLPPIRYWLDIDAKGCPFCGERRITSGIHGKMMPSYACGYSRYGVDNDITTPCEGKKYEDRLVKMK